jgi:hypothetical protein
MTSRSVSTGMRRGWPGWPAAATRQLRAQRVGAGQPLAVGQQGQEAVGLCVGARVGGGFGHLGYRDGGGESGLGGTDRGCLRVGVDHARDGVVVGLAGFAEDAGGGDLALVFAEVGEQPHASDVADRPHSVCGAQVCVNRYPVLVGFHADRFQAEPVGARPAAGGREQVVATQFVAVVEGEDVVLAIAPRGGRVHAEPPPMTMAS